MTKRFLILLTFVSFAGLLLAQEVSVALFYDRKPQGITLTVQKGFYLVYENDALVDTIEIGANINIIRESEYLVYRHRSKAFATSNSLKLVGVGDAAFFINYTGSVEAARNYDGWLLIKRNDYFIDIIDFVPLDSYIAGVVEGKGGTLFSEEYYKAMSVLYRTLTVYKLNKHKNEGFDFCDGSHCQLYKAKAGSRVIIQAAKKTTNMVMVDRYMNIFEPLYHVNSGGVTSDGYNVTGKKCNYLKIVKDTFAVYGNSYSWKLLVPGIEWQEFLVKKGMKTAGSKLVKDLIVKQPTRLSAFKISTDSVKLDAVMSDLGWQSAFFDMTLDKSGVITVVGKGSGHGAGISIESAQVMASKGYTYDVILKYFYKDIHIVNVNNLNINFNTGGVSPGRTQSIGGKAIIKKQDLIVPKIKFINLTGEII
ncbi:MAG TPA: SpoIID/LytB domain-containing protein [Bacteroidales bacterium]|nr:SpoIID/LytB domain-containing protein [Bacteroidales bacterium]